eukprot:XP_001704185.1 VSP [Giardia lamblia ATCC 50803]
MGVEGCATCTAPTNNKGAATCTECQDGYYNDGGACTKCHTDCETCSGAGPNACTSCKAGKFLKTDTNTCVEAGQCGAGKYADKQSGECKACSEITGCTACAYNDQLQKPVCSTCGGAKPLLKGYVDGSTECVDKAGCAALNTVGTHFLSQDENSCILCSATGGTAPDEGIAECSGCKKTDLAQPPICSACLPGFYFDTTCKPCGTNCATCNSANANQCQTCKPGYFLKGGQAPGECVSCDSVDNKGREGCSACSNSGTFKCTDCKPNYRKQPNGDAGNDYTCVKTCEDDTACGGTSGACDAMIIDSTGKELHYCSYCGDNDKYPIDGLCATDKQGNTCDNHVCESCTTGYFMYMGGCYSISAQPGKSMCTKAGEGVCTEAAAGYFIPPSPTKDKQSVLSCGNPLGVELAGQKAYVGVDGCSQCTAPTALTEAGMTAAICTSCDSDKKPNKDGTGCVTCSVGDCKSCVVDDVCGECNSGFSLDNGKCVSSGTNRSGLSTGAVAGISVAVVVVVGGLVGFLCWWFVCRGKA